MAERNVDARVRVRGARGASSELKSFAKGFVGIAAAVQGIRATVGLLAEFGAKVSEVQAITGASTDQMKAFTDATLDLGKQTKFTATEVASAASELGRAGFDIEQIAASLPGVLDLAAASATGLAQSADIASNVLSAFGLAVGEAGRVADVLAAASSKSNTTVIGLGESLKEIGPVANAAGIELEDVVASLGGLGNAGIKGTAAGNALKAILASLAAATPKTTKAIEDLGLKMSDLDPEAHSLDEIIGRLSETSIGMAEAFAAVGRKGAPALLALVSQRKEVGELGDELTDVDGIARKMAETMQDNLAGSLDKLKAAIQGVVLEAGEGGLSSVLKELVDLLTGLVNSLDLAADTMIAAWGTALKTIVDLIPGFGSELSEKLDKAVGDAVQRIADRMAGVGDSVKAVGDAAASTAPGFDAMGDAATDAGDEVADGMQKAQEAAEKFAANLLGKLQDQQVPLQTAADGLNLVLEQIGNPAELSASRFKLLQDQVRETTDRMIEAGQKIPPSMAAAAAGVEVWIAPMHVANFQMSAITEKSSALSEAVQSSADAAAGGGASWDELGEALGTAGDAAGDAEDEVKPLADEAAKLQTAQEGGAAAAADQATSLGDVKTEAAELATSLGDLLTKLENFKADGIVTELVKVFDELVRLAAQAAATNSALQAIDEPGAGGGGSPGDGGLPPVGPLPIRVTDEVG